MFSKLDANNIPGCVSTDNWHNPEHCSGSIGIADDVVVYDRNKSEHDTHLNPLIQVASQAGLVFNSKKCEINVDSVNFLGTIYDSNGAHPDPDKIFAIRDLSSPLTVVQLQHLLVIVTYLSLFIQNLANQTASLRELLKKDTEYDLTESHEVAFRTWKSVICNDSVLAYFDPEADTTIQLDASGKGIGATLMQNKKHIMYASKCISDTHQRYACIEREILAVCYGCTRFYTFGYGKHFTIETDHRPLAMIHITGSLVTGD